MDILELVQNKSIVVFDGAMGTQLAQRGAPAGGLSNIEAPDAVTAVHREYVEAGADVIITNTFCMNRIYIESHGLGIDVAEVNRLGVELAKKAAGDSACVLGEVGLTGQMLAPLGTYKEEQFYETFREQAGILVDAGADALIFETATDINEAAIALKACKENFRLPVVVSMAYATETGGGRTSMGNRAADCAKLFADNGADVIGANCGNFDPRFMAGVIEAYAEVTDIPLLAEPNAGKPRVEGDKTVYDLPVDVYIDEIIRPCLDAGVKLIGGCCGTSPDFIKAICDVVK